VYPEQGFLIVAQVGPRASPSAAPGQVVQGSFFSR
jgi:hypothetical protein